VNPELEAELRSELVRTLLHIALQDLVAIVRHAVDMNTTPSGTPTLTFEGPATALERFDRLGGFDALCLELWRSSPLLGAVLRNRTASDGIGLLDRRQRSSAEAKAGPQPSIPDGIGRDRTVGSMPAGRAP
jgi:hypothetical protein